jgi:DNA repair exonuclease SbcCD nuclease subunit
VSFRFLHTADWQLGKPFTHIPGDSGAELRAERISTVRRIAELARDKQLDAVLVAGDAFDSNDVANKTIVRAIDALTPFPGKWIFLPGNHDAALGHSVWTRMRELDLPSNIIIADRPEPIVGWEGRAAVLPAPLRRKRESLDQTEWFDDAPSPEGSCRIGLAHGSVAGRLPDTADAANEIPGDRAERAKLCYLALGDWHGALKIAPRTWYSGSPEPDRHKANESGFVQLVEIDGPGAPERTDMISVGRFCWIRLDIELLDGTCQKLVEVLHGLPSEHHRCVVSLNLSGSISLAERRRLEREIKSWEPRLHHLDVDDSGVIDDPTADDLDALDTSGFVRLAVDRLKEQATGGPEAEVARMALRMIYLDHFGQGA